MIITLLEDCAAGTRLKIEDGAVTVVRQVGSVVTDDPAPFALPVAPAPIHWPSPVPKKEKTKTVKFRSEVVRRAERDDLMERISKYNGEVFDVRKLAGTIKRDVGAITDDCRYFAKTGKLRKVGQCLWQAVK